MVCLHYRLFDLGDLGTHKTTVNYRKLGFWGEQEPEVIFLLGTAHLSQRSALDTARVIKVCSNYQQASGFVQ